MSDAFIAGYSDKLSARPGETIKFCVSSQASSDYKASLHQSISADPNPEGIGIIEKSTFLNTPVYIESGRVENFNIS